MMKWLATILFYSVLYGTLLYYGYLLWQHLKSKNEETVEPEIIPPGTILTVGDDGLYRKWTKDDPPQKTYFLMDMDRSFDEEWR